MANARLILVSILAVLSIAAAEPTAAELAADARSIEQLVNDHYAYAERLPSARMPLSDKLRAEAAAVSSRRELVRYAERALQTLADHHAIAGSSTAESWALVPSYSDLWVERVGQRFAITAVRKASPAARAGIRPGDHLLAVEGVPVAEAVKAFWSDLGLDGGGPRDSFAARILAAGRRNKERLLTIGHPLGRPRQLKLPNLYFMASADRPVLAASQEGEALRIEFLDSLGYDATIAAFDITMEKAKPNQRIIIDLTDTPGGGNTTVARAILGWFVGKPAFYQMHSIPAEQRRTGIARRWVEQVLPRPGKRHRGPVLVRVGRWTGSMGEGLAIGFHAIGARVEGDRMAGLLGAIYDFRLEKSGLVIKVPTERLAHVDGTPREAFVPAKPRNGAAVDLAPSLLYWAARPPML